MKDTSRLDPLADLPEPEALRAALPGPYRRCFRRHPQRGRPQGWHDLQPLPWAPGGFSHADEQDPAAALDYHTGSIWPQDGASQLPVQLLAPRPGETIIDCCAAPGSKSTQIGLALAADGRLICCDASQPRRRVLAESLARQGVGCALVTPMPVKVLAERHPGCADGVLVDAPCSGHALRSPAQRRRQAAVQAKILHSAARLVRPGGRLVYSTCTPYREENEEQVQRFLQQRSDWLVEPMELSGVDHDLAGLGGYRLWPHRHGTEPFFAIRLRAPSGEEGIDTLRGEEPGRFGEALPALPRDWFCWQRGKTVLTGTAAIAAVCLPSEARGLVLGWTSGGPDLDWQPWAVQALIAAGASADTVAHADALRLWAGEEVDGVPGAWLRTEAGAPLGRLDASGRRLQMPARLFRRCSH